MADGEDPGRARRARIVLLQSRQPTMVDSTKGTTMTGGTNGSNGTVFRLNTDGTGYRVLHHFGPASQSANPDAPLLFAQDGQLYGTSASSVPGKGGTVFALRPDGTGFRKLRTFTTNSGAAYRPVGGLIDVGDGTLYGTAFGGLGFGVVYRINRDGSGYVIRHTFTGGAGGNSPHGLTQAPDGRLLCVAKTNPPGGTNYGSGLLFRFDPAWTNLDVLASFDAGVGFFSPGPLAVGSDGALYGVDQSTGAFAVGMVFRLTPPDYQPRFVDGSTRPLPTGEFAAQIWGVLGQSIVVEASRDLQQWSSVAALVLSARPLDFRSAPDTNSPAEFYRVRVQ
jgi:hypothetical protein